MNWLVYDGEKHIPIDPKLFKHLSKYNITDWKERINEKLRHKEIMEMLK